MAFLDSSADASDAAEAGPPPQGARRPPGGPMAGGGPILAALANRQRGPQVSAPGPGDMGRSIMLVTQAYGMLKQALPGLMPGSPVEQDVLKITQRLSRHLPKGQPALGAQQTQLQDLLRNVMKNALLAKIMGQANFKGGGPQQASEQVEGGGGSPPALPGGAPAQAPMPSTPLPGA